MTIQRVGRMKSIMMTQKDSENDKYTENAFDHGFCFFLNYICNEWEYSRAEKERLARSSFIKTKHFTIWLTE